MKVHRKLSRRGFVRTGSLGVAAALSLVEANSGLQDSAGGEKRQQIPLKIGHRAASMRMVGDLGVFRVARQISGLTGVELQIAHGDPNLRDWDTVRRYKQEADRWGIQIPSLAGVWDRGVSILNSPLAGINLLDSIRAAELLGAGVILVAFFRDNAPDMNNEASYSPVVKLLQDVAPRAAEAGVILGLENSLSPADNLKLVDLIEHPSVRVYYDLHNMAYYGHGEEAISGVSLLGKERICQVHVKNGEDLIEEPGPIDWALAFRALNRIEYEGWYVFESRHPDRAHLLEKTEANIRFMQAHCRMPMI